MLKRKIVSIVAALALVIGFVPVQSLVPAAYASGQTELAVGTHYYGDKLATSDISSKYPTAKAFYDAISNMDLVSGSSIDVTDPAVIEQARAYTEGDEALIKNFGAAVDSFKYDHSEVFYVNWDNLTVNVYKNGDSFRVEIGTGRTDSYHLDPSLTPAQIKAQADEYNDQLEALVATANSMANGATDVKTKAAAATAAVTNKVTYDFAAGTPAETYVQSSYGALVNGKSVCEGYSRLFKQVMDAMGVQTELIYGNFTDGDSFEAHMWNYVFDPEADKGAGAWYAVDVTGCDDHTVGTTSSNNTATVDSIKQHKYFWRTADVLFIDHIEGRVISSVTYEMPYPDLRDAWMTPTSSGLFEIGNGTPKGSSSNWVCVSYDGMSAEELLAERGLYMAIDTAMTNRGVLEVSPMQSVLEWKKMGLGAASAGLTSEPGKTWLNLYNTASPYWEIAIFDIPDDVPYVSDRGIVSPYYKMYSDDAFASHMVEKCIVENPDYNPNYIKPAYINYNLSSPKNLFQKRQDITQPLQVEIVYDEPLRVAGGLSDDAATVSWDVSSYNNRDLSREAVAKNAKIENVRFEGNRIINGEEHGVISFKFTPSRAFNHNMIWYNFKLDNVVNIKLDGTDGIGVPEFSIVWAYSGSTACSNVFGDGRLWINTYAQPYLVSTTDMSNDGWTFEDGTGISAAQRSQMALVVTYPNDAVTIEDKVADMNEENAVKAAKTYEIDLNICGKHPVIPNGSYMNMNLGIPDEFADLVGNENVVFKLYHFKRNADGTLDYSKTEEIPCTFTKNGIVAKVTSFSPYVLVALDKDKVEDSAKTVVEEFNGKGGTFTVTNDGVAEEGGSVTYTFTPDDGYVLEYVKLNGESVEVTGNSVTLAYDQLAGNNILSFGFVPEDYDTEDLVQPPTATDSLAGETEDPNQGGDDNPGTENPGGNENQGGDENQSGDDNPGTTPGDDNPGTTPGDDNPGTTPGGDDNPGDNDNQGGDDTPATNPGDNGDEQGPGDNGNEGTEPGDNGNENSGDEGDSIEAAVHDATAMLDGSDSTWARTSGKSLLFRSGARYADFLSVRVDGKALEVGVDCDVRDDNGLVVELYPTYLSKLALGRHSIEIEATDGTAKASFAVALARTDDSAATGASDNDGGLSQTGDARENALFSLFTLLALSGATALVMTFQRRRIGRR